MALGCDKGKAGESHCNATGANKYSAKSYESIIASFRSALFNSLDRIGMRARGAVFPQTVRSSPRDMSRKIRKT